MCDPATAMRQDPQLVRRVLYSRSARQASQAMNNTGRKMSDVESRIYNELLDALDDRDSAAGVPEED